MFAEAVETLLLVTVWGAGVGREEDNDKGGTEKGDAPNRVAAAGGASSFRADVTLAIGTGALSLVPLFLALI